jgi:hypothetical protein
MIIMRSTRSSRVRWRALLATSLILAATLAIAAGAQASIPGPDGVINACYTTGPGVLNALSVIDSAASCPGGTNPLTWNMTGPIGLTGPAGPAGTTTGGGLPDVIEWNAFAVPHPQSWVIEGNGTQVRIAGPERVVPLPIGDWTVTAHLAIDGQGSCSFIVDGKLTDDNFMPPPGASSETLVTAVTETTGNDLAIYCVSGDPSQAYVLLNSLVAVHVGSVTIHGGSLPTTAPSVSPPSTFHPPAPPTVVSLSSKIHAHLVNIYYAPRSSPHSRQVAQIALLAGEGDSVAQIAHETFATPSLVTATIRAYCGRVTKRRAGR